MLTTLTMSVVGMVRLDTVGGSPPVRQAPPAAPCSKPALTSLTTLTNSAGRVGQGGREDCDDVAGQDVPPVSGWSEGHASPIRCLSAKTARASDNVPTQ